MSTDLRKKGKSDFEKKLFEVTNNAVFGKAMENVRKHRDIRLATMKKKAMWYLNKIIILQRFCWQ